MSNAHTRKPTHVSVEPLTVGSNTQPVVTLQTVKPWRDELDADDQKTVANCLDYAKFWQGVPNYSWKILVAKLANMLDGEH